VNSRIRREIKVGLEVETNDTDVCLEALRGKKLKSGRGKGKGQCR